MGAKIGKEQAFIFNRKKTLSNDFQKVNFNDHKFGKSELFEEKKEKSIEVFLNEFLEKIK